MENDNDATDKDVLRQVGIVKYPEQFEFCGHISMKIGSELVDYRCLPSGGIIYSSDLSLGSIMVSPSVEKIITIENRANYFEYIKKAKTEAELIIYHGGQYSPRKRKFFQDVAQNMPGHCKWFHWSDIDYGGFIMLSRLRKEINPNVIPYHMNSDEFNRYKNYASPINTLYAEKLNKLKNHAELFNCHECIDFMLIHTLRLEQEIMLSNI